LTDRKEIKVYPVNKANQEYPEKLDQWDFEVIQELDLNC